jgi:hypothetical protein
VKRRISRTLVGTGRSEDFRLKKTTGRGTRASGMKRFAASQPPNQF